MHSDEPQGLDSFLTSDDTILEPDDPAEEERKEFNEYLLQNLMRFSAEGQLERITAGVMYVYPTQAQTKPRGKLYTNYAYAIAPSHAAFEQEHLPSLSEFLARDSVVRTIAVDAAKLRAGIAELLDNFGARTVGDVVERYGGIPQPFIDCGIAAVIEPAVTITVYSAHEIPSPQKQ